jgi:hypothetical protein
MAVAAVTGVGGGTVTRIVQESACQVGARLVHTASEATQEHVLQSSDNACHNSFLIRRRSNCASCAWLTQGSSWW